MNNSYQEYVDRILKLTKHVSERWKSRLTGSESCLESGKYLAEEMSNYCEKVERQEFEVHPAAFLGYIRILVALYPIALFALWQEHFWLLLIIGLFGVLLVVFEFFIYWEFIDPFFPKKKGMNVMGRIEPTKEVKQQIIISGHHDSAHIFNFFVHQPKLYPLRVLGSMLATFLLGVFGILFFTWDQLGIIPSGLLFGVQIFFSVLAVFVMQMWFFYSSQGTPGAGDNLASSATAMELGRYFRSKKDAGNGLAHTRLILASWDAEEAGLRGAKAYVKENREQLRSIPTYNMNIECLYEADKIFFLSSDINGFVQLSSEMGQEAVDIARKLGYESDIKPIVFAAGGTDAAEFARAGIEATTLFGMGWTIDTKPDAYHTLKDTVDAVDPEAVRKAFDIIANYVEHKDKSVKA
ncbi:MAG: M28 family peptidase [Bacteroidota bacterium]